MRLNSLTLTLILTKSGRGWNENVKHNSLEYGMGSIHNSDYIIYLQFRISFSLLGNRKLELDMVTISVCNEEKNNSGKL